MKSLFAQYVKERLNWDTIEVDGGFISYILYPPNAMIKELYVKPELRGTPLAKRLADLAFRHAREAGCSVMFASIVPQAEGANHALKSNLHYGFKLSHIEGADIILKKEIDQGR